MTNESTLGTLYVVSTPIGNMGDMTPRAVEVLKSCHAIVAEDTRHTRGLLSFHGIMGKELTSLHAHSDEGSIRRLVVRLEEGQSLAIVTDAGTPIVSDPGQVLVERAVAIGVRVVPVPGASAVLAALAASGLAGDGRFRFFGFLPRSGPERGAMIREICDTPEASILFESPNRIDDTIAELAEATPTRAACVARELTKMYEEFVRGPLADLAKEPREWKGEAVIVLGPFAPLARVAAVDDDAVRARIREELGKGAHAKTIADRVAAWSGRPRRTVYEWVIAEKSR